MKFHQGNEGDRQAEAFFKQKPVGLLINIVADRFEQEFLRRLTSSKSLSSISVADHRILKCLTLESPSLNAVAAHLGISKQAVSKAVSSLARRGFMAVTPSPYDKRVQILTLTASGARLVRRAAQIARDLDRAGGLGDSRQRHLK